MIYSYTREKSNVHFALIDLTKAFDQTNFDALIYTLQKTQVPSLIIKLFSFLFIDSFVNVYFNGELSDEWKIGNGARQGENLSSILFNFNCNDVIERTLEVMAGYKLDVRSHSIVAYADDIALLLLLKLDCNFS